MKTLLLGIVLAACVGHTVPVAGQPAALGSDHGRAGTDDNLLLRVGHVRLVVPPGAVADGAVVGLGVGGVPNGAVRWPTTSVVVTAAAGLAAPLVVVIAPQAADLAWTEQGTPVLRDVATGERQGCLAESGRFACAVLRPGAYVLDRDGGGPRNDDALAEAVARVTAAEAAGGATVSPWVLGLAATLAGVTATLVLLGGGRGPEREAEVRDSG
jgi:hypothetical protein